MSMSRTALSLHGLSALAALLVLPGPVDAAEPSPAATVSSPVPRLCFIGLHGGEFDVFRQFAQPAGLSVEYARDDDVRTGKADFSDCQAVYIQHFREEDTDQYLRLFREARVANPAIRFFSISDIRGRSAEALAKAGLLEHDAGLKAYHGTTPENLRRTYAGQLDVLDEIGRAVAARGRTP